ncbi:MAG: hypothetical protein UX10_C0001G0060, partial [Candidatus Magasanikbacteria bacterium GW2011_GWA2_45_39]
VSYWCVGWTLNGARRVKKYSRIFLVRSPARGACVPPWILCGKFFRGQTARRSFPASGRARVFTSIWDYVRAYAQGKLPRKSIEKSFAVSCCFFRANAVRLSSKCVLIWLAPRAWKILKRPHICAISSRVWSIYRILL